MFVFLFDTKENIDESSRLANGNYTWVLGWWAQVARAIPVLKSFWETILRFCVRGTDHGSSFKLQASSYEVRGSRFKLRGSRKPWNLWISFVFGARWIMTAYFIRFSGFKWRFSWYNQMLLVCAREPDGKQGPSTRWGDGQTTGREWRKEENAK